MTTPGKTETIHLSDACTIILGDCRDALPSLSGVHSCVTDPPYGLSFMGKHWDYDVPGEDVWRLVLACLLPGAHLLSFAGTRTQHRMAVRIEDAGFEIRDMIAWVYGSGFPKSLDVGKSLDAAEKKKWLDVCKALDNAEQPVILGAWKEYSKTASGAGLSFAKSETATGTNTPESGSVLASVLLQANPESSDAIALVAELSLTEARRTSEAENSSVLTLADESESPSPARSAESQRQSGQASNTPTGSVRCAVMDWQSESAADKLKAVEALRTWLGSKPSSRQADTVALCAALTADLKHITASRSKTFQSFDTTRQTACVSAIGATITESTAASLISFMVDTLKSKAIDKASGAEREVVGIKSDPRYLSPRTNSPNHMDRSKGVDGGHGADNPAAQITAPATEAAKQWDGWGTALKPSHEPVGVYYKPLTMEMVCAILLADVTEQIWRKLCQRSNVSASDAESLLSGIRARLEKAAALTVAAHVRISVLEKPESAILAARSSTSRERTETAKDTIRDDSVLASANPNGNASDTPETETQAGRAGGMSMVDTFISAMMDGTSENIALSWSTTLAEVLNQANTFTTRTALRLTTELKTLKSLMQANTLQSTGNSSNYSPALEPITVARKPLEGTVAANVLEHGTGAINVDGCRVSAFDGNGTARRPSLVNDTSTPFGKGAAMGGNGLELGRWPANLIHDGSDEVVGLFPQSSGNGGDSAGAKGTRNTVGGFGFDVAPIERRNDTGAAARFFYCAKASKSDRDEGCEGMEERKAAAMNQRCVNGGHGKLDGRRVGPCCDDPQYEAAPPRPGNRNHHPTVKPTDLMRYLCRLVTPPDGIVLDPFMGSGSTGKAALREGFRFIGIERDPESFAIARRRLENELRQGSLPLFDNPGGAAE